MLSASYKEAIAGKKFDAQLKHLYGEQALESQRARYCKAIDRFVEIFGEKDIEVGGQAV